MRYKKCECGKIIAFEEGTIAPLKCSCGRKLGFQTYSQEDLELISVKSQINTNETLLYFEEISNGWVIDIPDDANDYIIGRSGATFSEHNWCSSVSRKHITVTVSNGEVIIYDFSKNGTRINGKKITKEQPTKLLLGDIITLDAIRNVCSFELKERR